MRGSRAVFALALSAALAAPAVAWPRAKDLARRFAAADAEERIRLAPALGRTRSAKAVDALLAAFDARKGNPRETAAVAAALGLVGDPRASGELADADAYLLSIAPQLGGLTPQLQVLRVQIIRAAGLCGGPRAVSLLTSSLDDKEPRVVEEAARGLGRLRVKDAAPRLEPLLGRGGDLAQAALESFALIGGTRAAAAVEPVLGSTDPFVAVAAAYALAAMDRKGMIDRLESELKTPSKNGVLAAYYLARLDRTAGIAYLDELAKGSDPGLAILAAEALGKSENPRAVLPLTESAHAGDPDLRASSARGLGRIGGGRAIAALKTLRDDSNPVVKSAAASALVELGEVE